MAMITTYGGLKTAVQNWLNRSDDNTVQTIPFFIDFATTDFQRTIQLPQYEKSAKYVIAEDDPALTTGFSLEPDYFEMKHVFVNNKSYARVDVDTFRRIVDLDRSDEVLLSGDQPQAKPANIFTRIGNFIQTFPALKEGDTVDVIYWFDMEYMSQDSDHPDYLLVAPDIMLYLSLRHAAVFLRDNDQAQFWEQKASEAAAGLMRRLDTVEWSGSPITVTELAQGAR